jgi:hypothetical protein
VDDRQRAASPWNDQWLAHKRLLRFEQACTVAGTFENTSSSFTDEWNGSIWSVDPPLPLPPRAVLNRVSCTSNGPCTAVGYEIKEFIGTGGSIALALHSQ